MPPVPYRVLEFEALASTNAYAADHLGELRDRDIVTARVQTAGRGRLHRSWVSHVPGNIYASIVLKPAFRREPPLPLANLTQSLSLAICRALERQGLAPVIKWPNDVLVQDCKIAGILAELRTVGDDLRGVVLGFGINLNLDAATVAAIDQPATALNLLTGRAVDCRDFLHSLLDDFFKDYSDFLAGGFAFIREAYLARTNFLGRCVTVRRPAGEFTGTATGLDDEGALLLRMPDGSTRLVQAGDMAMV